MAQTTVSSKYQVVIPKEIRNQLPLKAGQKLQVILNNGVISLVPDRPLTELRGFLKGMPTDGIRDKDDRF